MSRCKLCGAEIQFVRTALDRLMPIDPKPHPDGTVELRQEDETVVAYVVGNLTLFDDDHPIRYMPHWFTCQGDITSIRKSKGARKK